MNSSVQTPLKVYGGDQYGQGISLGAGGATVVGGGESAKSCENLLSATTEQLWLTSDNSIYFYTNCNTIGNKVGAVLDNSRQFYPNVNNTGSLGTSTYRWANLYANSLNGTTLNSNARASSSVPGLTKLYTSSGSATDGTMTQKAITDNLLNISNKIKVVTVTGASGYGNSVTLINNELVTQGTSYIGTIIIRDQYRGFLYLPFNITAVKNASIATEIVCQTYKDGNMVTYTFPFTSTIIDDNHVRLTLQSGSSSWNYCTGANYIKITP